MEHPLTLMSWNVNGLRAVHRKGFMDWFTAAQPDILALQEIRALPDQVPAPIRQLPDYHAHWYPAQRKKGYSGVGLLSRPAPVQVIEGLGVEEFDVEGRVLIVEYDAFYLLNAYFPSGSHDKGRVPYKLAFSEAFLARAEELRQQKPVIFCGDINVAHQPIDLTHAKANEKNSGFLPEERAWVDKVLDHGYIDTFRHLHPDVAEVYSWWTMRGNARQKNVGWRIDYFFISQELLPALREASILTVVTGSDHAPVVLTLDLS